MKKRPPQLRRSSLFLPGADARALELAPASGADVLIQELEDFTPPELRPAARNMAAALYATWRATGALAGVRVNPFESCGREDLAAVMRGKPDIVMISKVARPEQVAALDAAVAEAERAQRVVKAFEAARAAGHDRVELDGALVEVPRYAAAKRLIERAKQLTEFETSR